MNLIFLSGHSRWSQIKHKKALSDQKKSQIFSKLSKLISVTARNGTDPEINPQLKSAIEKARALHMPAENIQRAIDKTKSKPNALTELIIEAIGPGNSILIIEAITDNKNRTLAEVKSILSKNESKMITLGSQLWQFERVGILKIPYSFSSVAKKNNFRVDDLELQLIEAGVEKIEQDQTDFTLYTSPDNFDTVKNVLTEKSIEIESVDIEYKAKMPLSIEDDKIKTKLTVLFTALDEHSDIKDIYSNVNF